MSSDGNEKRKAGDSGGALWKLQIILLILCTNLASVFLFCGPFHWVSLQYLHDPSHNSVGAIELIASLNQTRRELHLLKQLSEELTAQIEQLTEFLRTSVQDSNPHANGEEQWGGGQDLTGELREFMSPKKLPLGHNPSFRSDTIYASIGQVCALLTEDFGQYMEYDPGELCPEDEVLAQKLMFRGCEPLPRRRCFPAVPPITRKLFREDRRRQTGGDPGGVFLSAKNICQSMMKTEIVI